MNNRISTATFFIAFPLLYFLFPGPLLQAQISLENPDFPRKESISYIRTSDSGEELVQVKMELVETEAKPYYRYELTSESEELLVKFSPDTFTPFYSEVWEKTEESTVHRINEIVRNEKQAGEGELLIPDAQGFDVSLRAFPWEHYEKAQLVFLNNSSDNFSLELKVKGQETIDVNGASYRCREVQVGLGGFIGGFFPKSHYWYTVAPPHFLVRAESAGMGGGDESVMELRSYTATK